MAWNLTFVDKTPPVGLELGNQRGVLLQLGENFPYAVMSVVIVPEELAVDGLRHRVVQGSSL